MKRYDGILLCSDYDHTLTSYTYEYKPGDDRFACIPENNIEAVKRFTAAGGTFAVVSGRNPDEIGALKSIMPISDLCVCCNGTAVYSFSERRAVLSYTMDERCLDAVRFFAPFADEYEFIRITDSDFKFTFFSSGDDFDTALSGPRFPAYKMVIMPRRKGCLPTDILWKCPVPPRWKFVPRAAEKARRLKRCFRLWAEASIK